MHQGIALGVRQADGMAAGRRVEGAAAGGTSVQACGRQLPQTTLNLNVLLKSWAVCL